MPAVLRFSKSVASMKSALVTGDVEIILFENSECHGEKGEREKQEGHKKTLATYIP